MRKSQYNLLGIEEDLQNKQVYVCTNWGLIPTHAISQHHFDTPVAPCDGFVTDSFMSWMKIKITPLEKHFSVSAGEEISIPVKVISPYINHPKPNEHSRLTYRIYGSNHLKLGDNETGILLAKALQQNETIVKVRMPQISNNYKVFISATQDNYPPPINSGAIDVVVN